MKIKSKIIFGYFLGIMISLGLLFISSSIPSSHLLANATETLNTFEKEGTYPSYGIYPRQIVLDNYTDSIMVNTAYSAKDNSLKSALLAERQILSTSEVDQIKNLRAAVEGTAPIRVSYERYWHGYLIFLRPQLALFNYQQIRMLNQILLLLVFSVLVVMTYRKRDLARAAALVAGVATVDFFFASHSLQFSAVFWVGMFISLFVLIRPPKNLTLIYFIAGMLTVFFDLLTAPLITLGLVLIADMNKSIKKLLMNLLDWLAGYWIFGVSKWLLVDLLYNRGVVADSLGHVINRTITQADSAFSHVRTIQLNLFQLIGYARLSQIIVLGISLILLLIFLRYRKRQFDYRMVAYWLIVASLPYIWYLVAANHSYLHVWYTYRAQFVTVMAAVMIYSELVNWRRR